MDKVQETLMKPANEKMKEEVNYDPETGEIIEDSEESAE